MGEFAGYALQEAEEAENDRWVYRQGQMSDEEAYDRGIIDELGRYRHVPAPIDWMVGYKGNSMGEMADMIYEQEIEMMLDGEFDDDNGRAGWFRRQYLLDPLPTHPLRKDPKFRRLEKDREKLFGLRRKP